MTDQMIGIIPAAGSGVRARPYSYEVHKGLFEIDGRSNLERTIQIMRDDLGISEVVVVIGYMGESVKASLGDGERQGVKIHYVENQHLDRGWAWSVLLAKPFLAGRHACIMLSDEFYLNTNIADLKKTDYAKHAVTVAVKQVEDQEVIKRNFSVERSDTRIVRLIENPVTVHNDVLGMATFVVSSDVIGALEETYEGGRQSIEFVSFVDGLIGMGKSVVGFDMNGTYMNLNDVSSLEAANDIAIRARLTASE